MAEGRGELGMIGLGTMGQNLLLNMADHGYSVVGFDIDRSKGQALIAQRGDRDVQAVDNMAEFTKKLRSPRAIMALVPAGAPVDHVICDLCPHLDQGDILIDGGNSHYTDTEARQRDLESRGIHLLGVGISGGAEGARHGPSIMPGGAKDAYERVQAVLEAISAKVDGEDCCAYMGQRGAGHYVKMVHNGIEYALMQLISECYDYMKRGLGLSDDKIADAFQSWEDGDLNGYLMEITSVIFRFADDEKPGLLLNYISDRARQKGTGQWTSQDAMQLQYPVQAIDCAVEMRDLSGFKLERDQAAKTLKGPSRPSGQASGNLADIREALRCGMMIAFAQGMGLLRVASQKYSYDLDLATVAKIWRGGCIIRSELLTPIRAAFQRKPDLLNLLLDEEIAGGLKNAQNSLRAIVCDASVNGIPVSALSTCLSYYDAYRSAWLPTNLIQAQRDLFGSHTYERIDKIGTFHTNWLQK